MTSGDSQPEERRLFLTSVISESGLYKGISPVTCQALHVFPSTHNHINSHTNTTHMLEWVNLTQAVSLWSSSLHSFSHYRMFED